MRPLKGGLSVGCGPHGGFLCQYIDNELSAKLKKTRARTPQIPFQRHSKTTFNGFKSVPLGIKAYLWEVQKCTSGGLGGSGGSGARGDNRRGRSGFCGPPVPAGCALAVAAHRRAGAGWPRPPCLSALRCGPRAGGGHRALRPAT